jgi:hypothetical protein
MATLLTPAMQAPGFLISTRHFLGLDMSLDRRAWAALWTAIVVVALVMLLVRGGVPREVVITEVVAGLRQGALIEMYGPPDSVHDIDVSSVADEVRKFVREDYIKAYGYAEKIVIREMGWHMGGSGARLIWLKCMDSGDWVGFSGIEASSIKY